MAIARIELCWDAAPHDRRAVIDAIHRTLVDVLRVPVGDPTVMAVTRPAQDVVAPDGTGDRYAVVTVTMFAGRTPATKRLLCRGLVDALGACGVAPGDVLIVLDEVPTENWGVHGGVPASETDVGFKIDV